MDQETEPQDRATPLLETNAFVMEPMYDLSERDYQSIIHQLVDTVVGTVGTMRQGGRNDEAYELTNRVNDILLDYDDDAAERVWMAAYGDDESAEGGLGAARDPFLL